MSNASVGSNLDGKLSATMAEGVRKVEVARATYILRMISELGRLASDLRAVKTHLFINTSLGRAPRFMHD